MPQTRVVVTGAGGQVGREVVARFREVPHACVVGLTRADCDVSDYHQVVQRLVPLAPDLIVHTAAWTDVDGCEGEPGRAYVHNALAVRHVRLAAQRCGADLIHLSSDYVFDGCSNQPYREWDATAPRSEYGRSKLAGEQEALLYDRSFVVRTSWVLGRGPNFARAIKARAIAGGPLRVVADQTGRPTLAADLAGALVDLFQSGRYGLWHVANDGAATWKEVAEEVVRLAGLSIPVDPITTAELARPAPRPAYSVLDDHLWRSSGFTALPPWREALARRLTEVTDG